LAILLDDHLYTFNPRRGCLQQSFISNPRQQARMGMLSDKNNVSMITLEMLKFLWTNLQNDGFKSMEIV
jgi:hypothetical protein